MEMKRGSVVIRSFQQYLNYMNVQYVVRIHTKKDKYNKPKDDYYFFDRNMNQIQLAEKMKKYYIYGQYRNSLPDRQVTNIIYLKKEEN